MSTSRCSRTCTWWMAWWLALLIPYFSWGKDSFRQGWPHHPQLGHHDDDSPSHSNSHLSADSDLSFFWDFHHISPMSSCCCGRCPHGCCCIYHHNFLTSQRIHRCFTGFCSPPNLRTWRGQSPILDQPKLRLWDIPLMETTLALPGMTLRPSRCGKMLRDWWLFGGGGGCCNILTNKL